MDKSSIDLPDGIIESILSKCPVKSVVRFKSVSKSWQSIISNPRFFRILQSNLLENQNKFFIWMEPPSPYELSYAFYMILEDGNFRREEEFGYPSREFEPLCSCNGLILLGHYTEAKYMLWNPFIKKHTTVPFFKPDTGSRPWRHHHHLYHDSITDDYKIVIVYEIFYAVYSCKNGSWDIKDLPCNWDRPLMSNGFFVNGCLYVQYDDEIEIMYFDARDGKLHKFRQPKEVECLVQVRLRAVSGRLCLHGLSDDGEDRLQLWVLEENGSFDKCWRKLISMDEEEPNIFGLIPVCLSNKVDVVFRAMVPRRKTKYFIYNSRQSCSFKRIDFDWKCSDTFFPYSENLCMPSSNT